MPDNINNNIPVRFKRGEQASLPNVGVEGSFYLATDTNRLFYAGNGGQIKELNLFVHSVETFNSLPTNDNIVPGDFYYIKDANILAIYKEGTSLEPSKWVLINADSYLTNEGYSFITVNNSTTNNISSLIFEVRDNHEHSVTGSFAIAGGNNVNISSTGNKIIIDATDTDTNTTYSLSAAADSVGNKAQIRLTSSNNNDAVLNVTIEGSNGVSISSTNNTITLSAPNLIRTISHNFNSDTGSFYTNISVVGSDDIISSNSIIPTIYYGKSSTTNPDYTTSAKFSSLSNTGIAALNLDVYSTTEVDALIASKFSNFDSMRYCGVISTTAQVPISDVRAGDTYKISTNISFDSTAPGGLAEQTVIAGDLLIANINLEGNISWDIIPSGDDLIISASVNTTNNLFLILDRATLIGGIKFSSASTTSTAPIDITNNSTTSNAIELIFAHGNSQTGTTVSTTETLIGMINVPNSNITTIDGLSTTAINDNNIKNTIRVPSYIIEKDDNGHITSITGKEYRINDTHGIVRPINAIFSVYNYDNTTFTSTTNGNTAFYYYGIGLDNDDNNTQTATLGLSSNNLGFSTKTISYEKQSTTGGQSTTATVTCFNINLEWESF